MEDEVHAIQEAAHVAESVPLLEDPAFWASVGTLIFLGILCLVCVLGVLSLDSYLGHLQEVARTISLEEAAEKTHRVARVVLGAVSLGAVGMALYLALLAARILKHRRFPPPDTRVISDTRVLSGLHARVYGWVSLLLAVLLLVMGVLLPLRAEQILERQLDPRLRPIPQNNQDLGLGPW